MDSLLRIFFVISNIIQQYKKSLIYRNLKSCRLTSRVIKLFCSTRLMIVFNPCLKLFVLSNKMLTPKYSKQSFMYNIYRNKLGGVWYAIWHTGQGITILNYNTQARLNKIFNIYTTENQVWKTSLYLRLKT